MKVSHVQPFASAAVDGGSVGTAPAAPGQLIPLIPRGSRIVGNALALILARPLTWLSTIGLTILLPRYLGDVNLGKFNLAFVFADWCGLLVSLGISRYLV